MSHSFSGRDGSYPWGGLVLDNKGNLFGTTFSGGSNDAGTIFELTYVPGAGWTEHVLYNFQGGSDGDGPAVTLIFDPAGNLYGTTTYGGNGGGGTVFELSPSGDTWTFKLLYSLSGFQYCGPSATVALDVAGNLYGTFGCGGLYNQGYVFKLSNTQNGWVYSSLYDFTGGDDGKLPQGAVSIDTDGTLYGTASQGANPSNNCPFGCGTVWMIKP